jgi:hypothetical protein
MMSDSFNVDWSQVSARLANGTMVATGRDADYTAEFYMGKVPNFEMTDYTEVPHLRLQIPGSKTVYDQPARLESRPDRPSDAERFPHAWLAFKNGQKNDGTGTPLDQIEGISENDIRRLEINGVNSVEQLASVADVHLDGLGFGGRVLRERARAFLIGRPSVDPEKAELKDQVGKLTDILSALMEKTGITMNDLLPAAADGDAQGESGKARGRSRQAAEA